MPTSQGLNLGQDVWVSGSWYLNLRSPTSTKDSRAVIMTVDLIRKPDGFMKRQDVGEGTWKTEE